MQVEYTYDQIHKIVADMAPSISDIDAIVAIGGGGLVPARILRNFLKVPVYVVTLESYNGSQKGEIYKRQWIDQEAVRDKRVLVVDELNDTGSTLVYCVNELQRCLPTSVAVAVVHDKKKEKDATLPPDIVYHVGEYVGDQWIVYPWEKK